MLSARSRSFFSTMVVLWTSSFSSLYDGRMGELDMVTEISMDKGQMRTRWVRGLFIG